jgi:hypothetical protein
MMSLRAGLVLLVLALLLPGCGGAPPPTPPVSGRVTLDGKPLANAMVMFIPVAGPADKDPLPSSVGTTDENGHYSLVLSSITRKATGAVVGKHKVMITIGAGGDSSDTKPTFHKQLPQQYNRKTQLECEVPAAGRDDANFDLSSKGP